MNRVEQLTEREIEVLRLSEFDIKDAANRLHLSPKSVERCLHGIREKLGVSNTRAAIFIGFREGWLK